jgi:hypothetical protein
MMKTSYVYLHDGFADRETGCILPMAWPRT